MALASLTPLEAPSGEARRARLRLYIAAGTPNSARAELNLRTALGEMDGRAVELDLQIIDVFKNAKRALADGVVVTPTLIGTGEADRLVIMGDLTDGKKLNAMLKSLVAPL